MIVGREGESIMVGSSRCSSLGGVEGGLLDVLELGVFELRGVF
jgi:hypothetical protein